MGAENPTYHQILGDTDIIQLPDRRTWNVTDGVHTLKRFAGTDAAIRAKFNELSSTTNSGVDELEEDVEGKSGRLIARVVEDSGGTSGGNTEAANAIWELYPNYEVKPIESHITYRDLTGVRKRAIENYVRDPAKYPTTLAAGAETTLAGYYSNQALDYTIFSLILRKSLVVSNRSTITASYTGLNRVVTLASIAPPTVLLGALTSLPLMDGNTGAWEWKKMAPQVWQITRLKYQIVSDWHGTEKWATIYGGTWTPTYS